MDINPADYTEAFSFTTEDPFLDSTAIRFNPPLDDCHPAWAAVYKDYMYCEKRQLFLLRLVQVLRERYCLSRGPLNALRQITVHHISQCIWNVRLDFIIGANTFLRQLLSRDMQTYAEITDPDFTWITYQDLEAQFADAGWPIQ